MTPEQIEAKFFDHDQWLAEMRQFMIASAQREAERVTREAEKEAERDAREARQDARIDALADRVEDLAEQAGLMMIAINTLTESAISYDRWKQETDQRFNVLLEEVRHLNRRFDNQ